MRSTLLLPLFPLLLTACAPTDEEAAVRACYDSYMEALRTGDGERLAGVMDRTTLAHYSHLLEMALSADSTAVAGLEPMDRITVLGLRANHTRAELSAMDARQVIAGAMGKGGGADAGSLESLGLGSIKVEGDVATAGITLNRFPIPGGGYTFRREEGQWRLDLTSLFKTSVMSMGFKAMGSEGMDRMIEDMLREANGGTLPEGIWHGPR